MEQNLTQLAVIVLCDDSTGCDKMGNYFATEADIMIDIVSEVNFDTLNKIFYRSSLQTIHPLYLIFTKSLKDIAFRFCILNSKTSIIRFLIYKLAYCF